MPKSIHITQTGIPVQRQVLLDMGIYYWHYQNATVTTQPDGTLTIESNDQPPKLIHKKPACKH